MIQYLLDTDTVSYLMKKKHLFHERVLKKLLAQPEGGVALSVISLAEIARGLEKLRLAQTEAGMQVMSLSKMIQELDNLEKTKNFNDTLYKAIESILSSLVVLEFTEEAAWAYGKVRTEVMQAGKDIGVMDALIAAHALSQQLVLVTNNTKHFSQVSGLRCENWCLNANRMETV